MTKINETLTEVAVICVSFALSACGAIPTADDVARERGWDAATGVQSVANKSGLGTIAYDERTSAKCKRRRSTGSNIRTSSCRSRDSGSQPVREVTYTEPIPTLTPGMTRPHD